MSNIQTESLGNYFKNIYDAVTSTAKGMWITFKYVWWHPTVTIQYPEEREILPDNSRNRLFNNIDECTACGQCANVCPANCIYLASTRREKGEEIPKASNGTPIRLKLKQYTIDMGVCCYCGLCTTVCPTECLKHTTDYEYSAYKCDDLKYDFLSSEVQAYKNRIVK